ncbi:unnamed protein product [Ceratitis capitata]|uniref:(Mediterranean fruit fly) hypothetical protein n=1 Tax=Ceratitis capitata TaxID=7213 RepID=A0A811V5H9_CERCA|nr:unnamed protein product [Ceratitis capitata]
MQLDGGPQQRQRGTHVDSKNQRSTRFDRSSISEAAASTAEAPKQQPHLPWQCPRSSSVRSAACVAELANSKIHRRQMKSAPLSFPSLSLVCRVAESRQNPSYHNIHDNNSVPKLN